MSLTETVGTACPYCGEHIEVVVDCTVAHQEYVEDCSVCCCPIRMVVTADPGGFASVSVSRDDE